MSWPTFLGLAVWDLSRSVAVKCSWCSGGLFVQWCQSHHSLGLADWSWMEYRSLSIVSLSPSSVHLGEPISLQQVRRSGKGYSPSQCWVTSKSLRSSYFYLLRFLNLKFTLKILIFTCYQKSDVGLMLHPSSPSESQKTMYHSNVHFNLSRNI